MKSESIGPKGPISQWLMAATLSAGVLFPVVAAADQEEELEDKLTAYESISLDVGADKIEGKIQKKKMALNELGRHYTSIAREGHANVAAENCFRLAELRREFALQIRDMDNPFEEGSDDYSSFEEGTRFMASHGQLMEASSSRCGYESVINAVWFDEADPQWAFDAHEAWASVRPDEARRMSDAIEEIRQRSSESAGEEESAEALTCDDGQACQSKAMERRLQGDDQGFVQLLSRACELDASHCGDLGYIYLYGISGVDRDMTVSQSHFERACDGGDRESCMSLAQYLSEGIGFEQDEERGEEFFEKACAGMERERCLEQFEARPD